MTSTTNPATSVWRRLVGRRRMLAASTGLLALFVVITAMAGVIAPYDPNAQDLLAALQPPSLAHWLGQDNLGRDVFSRIVYGGRVSIVVSILACTLAAVPGIALGLSAGTVGSGGPVGRRGVGGPLLVRRFVLGATDVLLSIPNLVVALVLAAILGGGVPSLVLAIGLSMVPGYIRVVNGLALSLRDNDFILAARLIGQSERRILVRHMLPNIFPSLIVLYTINLGTGILIESTLSYLGVGVSPPTASWGSMVADVYPYLLSAPWLVVSPGLCIVLVIVAVNILGDGLRDTVDPRLRGKL